MNNAQGNRTVLGFLNDESGATAIEYALIAAGIASAIAATVTGLGTSVKEMWESVGNIFS